MGIDRGGLGPSKADKDRAAEALRPKKELPQITHCSAAAEHRAKLQEELASLREVPREKQWAGYDQTVSSLELAVAVCRLTELLEVIQEEELRRDGG